MNSELKDTSEIFNRQETINPNCEEESCETIESP